MTPEAAVHLESYGSADGAARQLDGAMAAAVEQIAKGLGS
jgi:hypothetical protein